MRAIVLHHIKYSDNAIIATLYTESSGRQSFLIYTRRGKKSVSPSSLIHPLFLVELDMVRKEKRTLQQIKEIRNLYPYKSISTNIIKTTVAQFLA